MTVRTTVAPVRTWISYPVIGEPPSLAGAVHDTPADSKPRVATTAVVCPGSPFGVTALDAADRAPAPKAFTARTWRVYVVPLTRPVTVPLVAVRAIPVRVTAVPVAGVATIS